MSFVSVMPELLQDAARDLAGIRSALVEATATVAGPTTSIAAAAQDEVSFAISSLFGSFGREFQVVSAEAQAYHEQFANLVRAGAGAYLSAEAANAEQAVLGMASNGSAAAASPALFDSFGALVSNTATNLQGLRDALSANPAPFLRQVLSNQQAYAQTLATGFQNAVQNLPAELANLPTTIGAALSGANPVPILQQLVSNQIGYAQVIATSLQNAGNDFMAGLNAFPASLQAASQAFMAGDVTGGLLQIGGGLLNPLFTGFGASIDPVTNLISITPLGAFGDLLPIFSIPGQMAQNFTDLLPAGSVPAMVAQNATNVIMALTDMSQTLDLNTGVLHVGLPLVLALDAIGPPVTTLQALGSSANAFVGAIQTGDALGAAAALINAPAVVANGFLNGHATLQLPVSLSGLETLTDIPLGGILTPLDFAALEIPILGPGSLTLSGATFGGLLPGLLQFLPQQLAQAIGAAVPV
ncbi:PE family protein [Mycobacterium bourgelatii]|uniref:PE family protein n=1 Tax=Mycobacterium bourgelatii TaxID=1273442 RepID=A0A7I9YMP7_MYCBU|nr:PE family protein [Mycobacterium bourgelatii]MCV6975632.1 PE family protein [Mycobacterium bourgelatii]GFG89954.1 PE family protein [Mycobacterium bourgelatii]